MKVEPPLLVLVEWDDTKVVDSGTWADRHGAIEAKPERFQQVGWLLERTATELVLTSTLSHDIMAPRDCIPMGVVRSVLTFDPAFGEPLPPLKRKRRKP